MPLIDAEAFRNRFVINNDVPVDDYVTTASESIKEWVGVAAYTDAEKLSDGNEATSPVNPGRAHRLRLAELYLAMYYYYPAASIQIESGVIVLADRSEGNVVRQFEGAKARREGRQGFYDMAFELVEPYLIVLPEPVEQEEALPGSTFVTVVPGW